MGTARPVRRIVAPEPTGARPRFGSVARGRPRDFTEWRTLYRWGKLPAWERSVAGYLLRTAREDAGLTQKQLAARLGVSQQAVAQAERWRSNPTVDFMRRWAEACGASVEVRVEP